MNPETVFKAMADRTRHRALALLYRHELSVSELVEVLSQPQSTVSRHLKVLREAGLIRDRRDANTIMYAAQSPAKDANGSALSGRILDWVGEQALAPALQTRLKQVIRRRSEMSDRFFDRVGRHGDTLREESFGGRFHLEAFLTLLPRDWTVADVGTGTGYLVPPLAAHFKRVIAVDPVEAMLEVGRHRVKTGALRNVDLRSGDLSRLPISDASVDLAVGMLVLHHVPVPSDAMSELHRIVREGGHVLIVEQTVHESEAFRDRMQDQWWGFAPGDFVGMMENVGFGQVQSRTLATPERAPDAPELFVVTGRKRVSGPDECD